MSRDRSPRRVLFFPLFARVNRSVQAGLQEQFPDAEIRAVDLIGELRSSPLAMIANGCAAVWSYWPDLLRRRRDLDDSFFGTRYAYWYVRKRALEAHQAWPADCSFQTQSMFDCSAPGVPHFVYTDHTYETRRENPWYGQYQWSAIRPEWLIALERKVYEHSACTFTRSTHVHSTLRRAYGLPSTRVACVGAGCDASVDGLRAIPIDRLRYDRKRVLFVGVAWERKGGPELLEAFRRARVRHPDATLTVVGSTPKIDEPGVEVVGKVPLARIEAYYAQASIFCLPTKLEPFGLAFLEALSAGLPVIALRLGAAPDFVIDGDTGVLAEPGDVDGLTEGLVHLLDRPDECMRLGSNGRRLVAKRYTWANTCAAIAATIRERLSKVEVQSERTHDVA